MCCSQVKLGNEICIEFWIYVVVLICAKLRVTWLVPSSHVYQVLFHLLVCHFITFSISSNICVSFVPKVVHS